MTTFAFSSFSIIIQCKSDSVQCTVFIFSAFLRNETNMAPGENRVFKPYPGCPCLPTNIFIANWQCNTLINVVNFILLLVYCMFLCTETKYTVHSYSYFFWKIKRIKLSHLLQRWPTCTGARWPAWRPGWTPRWGDSSLKGLSHPGEETAQ